MKFLSLKKSIIVFSIISLFSCEKATEVSPTTDQQAALKTQVEKMLPIIQNQIKGQEAIQQIIAMIQELKGKYIPNGRVSAETSIQTEIPTCAKVTPDLKNKMVIVDFGTSGCKTPSGQTISGKLTISITNQVIKAQMENLSFDGASLNGILEIGGLYSKGSNPEITANANNLQVMANGKSSTFNLAMKMKWNAGFSTFDNKSDDDLTYSINGNMVVSEGTFDITTSKDVHYKGSCDYILAGIMEFKKGSELTKIDFGNDTCDDKATVSAGGYSKEIDMDDWK